MGQWGLGKQQPVKILIRLEFNLYKITLTCSDELLIKRINEDIKKGKRDKDCIGRSLERQNSYKALNTIKVDTTNKTVEEVTRLIMEVIPKAIKLVIPEN